MRREPGATARDFTRYLEAVAESGLREEEARPPAAAPAVRVMAMHAAKGLEFDHVFVLGLSAARMPGPVAQALGRRARRAAARSGCPATTARPTRARCAGSCTWR